MRTSAVAALDLRKHTVDIRRRIIVPHRGPNHFELLPYASARFTSARQVESLPDPLGNGHAAGARDTLDFPVFWIL
ncbi:MAG: hypothetical protein AUI12_12315 [Acidobacteria bacterium 13_2_20CM_2_57_6]|nr:MAG: hypothetical protein AUI12_12315 [Acidobacteria bacterium 13_2_20CM_2_57_6]